jgi:hypothetical protein
MFAWALPLWLGLHRGLVFALLPIATMWGGGGGGMGKKSTTIKGEDIQQSNGMSTKEIMPNKF